MNYHHLFVILCFRKDHERCEFDVHEVYGIDVLVSTGEGKVCGLVFDFGIMSLDLASEVKNKKCFHAQLSCIVGILTSILSFGESSLKLQLI